MILGRHQQTTARPSLIVTGPAAAGKTTALLNVGRTCHLAHTRKNPAPPRSAHTAVPIAYVLVPPGATAKTLITEFARYLGIPTTTRMTQTQITDAVCHTYTTAGVQLVMIDEIHRLNPRTTTGAQTADLLKDLTERLPPTFVHAGINVTDTPLFTGTRSAQLAGRATPPSSPAAPSPPATAPATPSATSSPTSKTTPTSHTTNPAPSPATTPTSTSAPQAASDPSQGSTAKPPSPPSAPAPNTSPNDHSTRYNSTTSPKPTTAPAPQPANPTRRTGRTALTSTNTNQAFTRQNYPQHTRPHSAQTAQSQLKQPGQPTRTAQPASQPISNRALTPNPEHGLCG
ncbi:TniB family NTP-binding protein [Streptomyces sp. NPDC004609]|uniref:TniB family NTP-binding protein n=1 Tax=Streptomyces sp. NPDC004609 TaxID=3364704 RepID=UPI0036C24599